jgi:hypothetical protein
LNHYQSRRSPGARPTIFARQVMAGWMVNSITVSPGDFLHRRANRLKFGVSSVGLHPSSKSMLPGFPAPQHSQSNTDHQL